MTWLERGDSEFVAAARQALRADPGADALDALGWWHLLGDLEDAEARAAVFALFQAHGRVLGSTPALCGLAAQPYLAALGAEPATTLALAHHDGGRRGRIGILVGDTRGAAVIVDRPGQGAWVVDADDLELIAIDVPGDLQLHEARVGSLPAAPAIGESEAARARLRSVQLGRVAIAAELLGAAEGALALALEHAAGREQFGHPIGTFQAVRHLLAWAKTDCVAIESAVTSAVAAGDAIAERYDEILKALAGRNARRACERSLQVLGALGFTAEHAHHRFHSRVLALDALLGSSADLTADLGAWMRTRQAVPDLPRRTLLTTHAHP